MRILHILPGRMSAATEAYAAGVIEGLHRAGLAQNVVLPAPSAPYAELARAGLSLTPGLERGPGFWPRRRMARLLAREKPDVIQCWAARGMAFVPRTKIPVVGWSAGDPRPFARCRYLAGAKGGRGAFETENEAPPVEPIPFFALAPMAPPVDRRLLATPKEARVLLAPARRYPGAGLDDLFDALEKMPGTCLWLMAEDPGRRALEKRATRRGLGERVRFPDADVNRAALLRAADAFILPALRHVSPATAIPEAFACGTPVIAVASPEAASLVEDGVNGILASDGAAIAGCLKRLWNDDGLRRRLVAEGYAAYVRNHTKDAVARCWIELYRRAAA